MGLYHVLCVIFVFEKVCSSLGQSGLNTDASKACESEFNVNTEDELQILWTQDKEREAFLQKPIYFDMESKKGAFEIKSKFYQVMASPLQSYCQVSKYFGGKWLGNCGALDGSKFVCMDKLMPSVRNGSCLVYSFGIGDDWSFENRLSSLNCRVHAFDPTIPPPTDLPKNIIFKPIGLAEKSGKSYVTNFNNVRVKTKNKSLKDFLLQNNDMASIITYLKVDVEGSELKAFPNWVSSGILKNVRQIGIEFHLGLATVETDGRVISHMLSILQALRELHKQGFRLVSYNPNNCVGKSQDKDLRFYAYFDIVLVNSNL